MGHRDLATTQRYVDYAPNEQEVEMFDRAFGMVALSRLHHALFVLMAVRRAAWDHWACD
ncbi:MAG TPA: hypothetical protein VGP18_04870 [Solirubrobacteraceae bacterium]|jgi:hypothetical protein|nr:hypothetical protein [Solirubrobacteraceae bacterium]